jgi:hypothetical protein
MKIPYSKRSIWGFLFFLSLTITFLFFGQPLYQKIMSIGFLLLAIVMFNHQKGVEITEDKRIRRYTSFFKYTFGKWEFLPSAKYILILRVKQKDKNIYRNTAYFSWNQEPSSKTVYQLNLIYQNNRTKKLISTNLSKAEQFASELGELLKIEVKKAT